MSTLLTEPRLSQPDALYTALSSLYHGLDAEESLRASARLILLLANHIGDHELVCDAIALARSAADEPTPER